MISRPDTSNVISSSSRPFMPTISSSTANAISVPAHYSKSQRSDHHSLNVSHQELISELIFPNTMSIGTASAKAAQTRSRIYGKMISLLF